MSRFFGSFRRYGVLLLLLAILLGGGGVFLAQTRVSAHAPVHTISTKVIAQYPQGEFLESVAFDRFGNLYVSLSIAGQIRKITPAGVQTTLATFPVGEGGLGKQPGFLGTLAIDYDGTVYATLNSTDATARGIWQVKPDGAKQRLAGLPENSQPNGITLDPRGNILVADAALGRIWRVARGTHVAEVWLADELLAPVAGAQFPGANGIKFFGQNLYVSNSSSGNILAIPVSREGEAGKPRIYAQNLPTDDFAFDVLGNLYATTHLFNTVVRVRPNGTQEVLASVEQQIIGPAAAAFGTRGQDRTNLYVVTDGGLFGTLLDPSGPKGPPSIVRLSIGLPGYPLR